MSLSVVIPTYQEAEGIQAMLRDVILELEPEEIIVVDDYSPDGTALEVLKFVEQYAGASEFKLIMNSDKGIGTAIKKGRDAAKGDLILSIDADRCFNLDKVWDMVKLDADLVVASRYAEGGRTDKKSMLQRLLSRWGNKFIVKLSRMPISDLSLNFRIYKREVWEDISYLITRKDNVMMLEELKIANKLGYSIAEVPVHFMEREVGMAKTNTIKTLKRYIMYLLFNK